MGAPLPSSFKIGSGPCIRLHTTLLSDSWKGSAKRYELDAQITLMTAVLYCAKGIKNKIEVRNVTSKWHSVGLVLLAWKGGEQTCLFICFLKVDFVLILFCCGVGKEACQLPEKSHCDSLCGLKSVPGVLSGLPTASWADPGCLGENEFSSHALGWADINRAFMNMKHDCWWAAYAGRWELRHSGIAHPVMISGPGRACLKLDRCCKLEISKERISVKPRAEELAVAKMDGGLTGISSHVRRAL